MFVFFIFLSIVLFLGGLFLLLTYITKVRELKVTLKKTQENLEKSNQVKNEFLSNISHEIRTPMNGILGVINILLETNLEKKQSDSLKLVKISAEDLMNKFNQSLDEVDLDYTKLETNQQLNQQSKTDLMEEEQRLLKKIEKVSLNVLLAEDNYINQKVAISLLEKKGWNVTLAVNGRELIEKYLEKDVDVILADIFMPEIDGVEATKRIRELEKTNGKSTPIIAMTALATMSDKYKCIDAGMDGFISKPINASELYKTICLVLRFEDEELEGESDFSHLHLEKLPFDLSGVLFNLNGNMEILSELLEHFFEYFEADLKEIDGYIRNEEYEKVQSKAHYVKGALNNLGAKKQSQLALELENMGKHKNLSGAQEVLLDLKEELETCRDVFEKESWLKINKFALKGAS